MILAVGTDLVDVDRLRARIARCPALVARLLSEGEREDCGGRAASLAARVAAKEAVVKALGSALARAGRPAPEGWRFREIEVRSSSGGAPHLSLNGVTARAAAELGATDWHLSLSHDAGLALAFVVAEG